MAETGSPLSVLIVGCGDIAGGYDEAGDDKAVRTHAGAYGRDDRFHVAACIDPDATRRAQFMAYWGVDEGFPDLAACRAGGGAYDVASVCVPTAHHGDALEGLLEMPLKAVLAEKPLTGDAARSRRIVEAYAEAARPLAVNYLRRFDAEMARLQAEIAAGAWGSLQSASAHYAKGLVNCGSHAIDLLHFLIGPLSPVGVTDTVTDYQLNDPTVSALLKTEAGAEVRLVGCDSRMYFPFELDLVMEKGRISLEDLGGRLRRRWVRPHPLFLHQPALDDGVWTETELPHALANAVGSLYDHLKNQTPLPSDGASALLTEEVCAGLIKLAAAKSEGERG